MNKSYNITFVHYNDALYSALIAMQTSDKFNVTTPAGLYGVAEERMTRTDDLKCQDWFFCTKKLDKDLVLNEILK